MITKLDRLGRSVRKAALISERTLDGLEAVRARGRMGGRRPKMTPGKLATAQQLHNGKTHTMDQIAEIVGVSRATLYRHLEPGGQRSRSVGPGSEDSTEACSSIGDDGNG